MISVVSNNLASNLIRKEEDSDSLHIDDSLWMPAGIGIVNRKSASDVITIKTKIIAPDSAKTMVIPKTIFDTGSDSSLVSSNIVKRLELDVDKTNAPDLSGVATKSNTMGLPMVLASRFIIVIIIKLLRTILWLLRVTRISYY